MPAWVATNRFPGDTRIATTDGDGPWFELGQDSWVRAEGKDPPPDKRWRVTAAEVLEVVGPELAQFIWAATARAALQRSDALVRMIVSSMEFPSAFPAIEKRSQALEAAIADMRGLANTQK